MKRETPFARVGAMFLGVARGAMRHAGGLSKGRTVAAVFTVATVLQAQTSGTWQAQDVGSVGAAGSSSASGGTFTVAGSGADIWGGSDAFQFYAQTLTGDGEIVARITGMTYTNGWAKAGVMMRDSLAANAPNVFLAATPDFHGIVAQDRATAGGDTTSAQGPTANAPYWLRLTRYGGAFFAATSADGINWMTFYSSNTAMGSTVYVGLAVTSHNDGTLCTATFDNVNVVATPPPTGGPPSAPTNLSASAVSSSQIALSWTNTSTEQTGFSIQRATSGSGFDEVFRSTSNGTTYTDSGLSPSLTYFYQVRGINSSGYGPASNTASATTLAPPASGAWQSADIGTSTAGQTSASGDSVTLTGSGRDIWNQADGFRYYYQPAGTGDCEMIVRVASLTNTSGWAKAGIMLRASLDPGSPQALICVSTEHGTALQWRTTANGDTQSSAPSEDGGPPRWLKLVFRAAGTDSAEPIPASVTGYVSPDGNTWTTAGSFYLDYSSSPWQYIGLAVTSHNDGALSTAQFEHVRLLTPPPAPMGFAVTHRGPNGEIDLGWSYSTTDVDQFVIRTNRETAGDHAWRVEASLPGTARQAVIHIGNTDGAKVEIKAYRDLVRSPAAVMWAKPTITPSLDLNGTTSSSVTLRVGEQFGLNGGESGPWSIERSSDGTNFVEIVSGLTPTGGTAYSDYTDYTDSGLPAGVTRYYRARELRTNGDSSAYSSIVTATTASTVSPLAAPSALSANAMSTSLIQLSWTDNATDETNYELQRSTDGTNFTVVTSSLAANTSSTSDGSLNASTTYYYRVRALNASGASAFSNVAHATTQAPGDPLPDNPWQSADVGAVAMAGNDSTSGSSITVNGGGADVWDNADSFRFRYQPLGGDGSITARVVSVSDTNVWAKAGVMMRNSLAAGSPNVFAAVTPEWAGIVAQARNADGGSTSSSAGPAASAPYWLRLTRAGNTFTAQASPDGATWTTYASFNVTMNSTIIVGLAVTSHDQSALCSALFENVSVTGASSPPPGGTWSAADIGAIGVAGSHTASGSSITINGSGADIWGSADSFRFVWQTRTGDGVVEAQVASMANTNGWAKAGVMIRESADANAPNVFAALTPSFHGIIAQARSTAGGETTQTAGQVLNAPYWVRIARSGNTFTASASPDGVTWTSFATFNVTMSSTASFGFAVTSHDNTQLNQAVFQDPYVGAP